MTTVDDGAFFFFRVVEGKPEVYPVKNSERMTLGGKAYFVIPIEEMNSSRPIKNPIGRPKKETKIELNKNRKRLFPRELVLEMLEEAGNKGIHPLAFGQDPRIQKAINDSGLEGASIGPVLAALNREKIAQKLADGRWYIK